MRIDETDTSVLAQQLRVGPRELLESIGGPWYVTLRDPAAERELPGTLFVGRAGPSVALFVDTAPCPNLHVGVASGQWIDPATLLWQVGEPSRTLTTPIASAPSAEVDAFLEGLRVAVDAAADARAPQLVTCRYCGTLVAPEHALGEESCQDCGTVVFGVVY